MSLNIFIQSLIPTREMLLLFAAIGEHTPLLFLSGSLVNWWKNSFG